MNYPRSLAPWAPYLSLFPREVSLALGTLVQRLAAAIGSMRSRSDTSAGDVDGFHGVARRGSYERLVTSEWVLADEMPDEFVRRAVMGEHLFLELARREPSAARVSLAIFDAGPNQLGSPRLAHIAALIVLARRAEAAGAHFGWGILQEADQPILPGVSTTEVRRLLDASRAREATPADIWAWRKRVEDWPDLDDFWLVGGQRVTQLEACRGLSTMRIDDVFTPDTSQLAITVQGVSSAARNLTLDLPEARICARLLRDPFQEAQAPPQIVKGTIVPASNLFFIGHYLFARSADGGILAYPVPNSPRAGRGKVKHYRSRYSGRIVAAGRFRKSIALVRANEHEVKVEYAHNARLTAGFTAGNYEIVHRDLDFLASDEDLSLQPCYRLPQKNRSQSELFVLDGQRQLFRLGQVKGYRAKLPGRVGVAWLVAREVVALGQQPDSQRIIYVGREVPDNRWRMVSIGDDILRRDIPFEEAPTNAFLGGMGSGIYYFLGGLAIEQEQATWWLTNGYEEKTLTALFGSRVVGVAPTPNPYSPLSLIVLESDQRTFALRDTSTHVEIHKAAAPVEQVTVSLGSTKIGYSTIVGEVVVYSLAQKEVLCRFLPEEKR